MHSLSKGLIQTLEISPVNAHIGSWPTSPTSDPNTCFNSYPPRTRRSTGSTTSSSTSGSAAPITLQMAWINKRPTTSITAQVTP
jgi:hypothetical protein